MKDGTRLAVNLYFPKGTEVGEKFPVLLEYLPYRKDDGMAIRDYDNHVYFSRHGYIGARVDIRGTGRSEGRAPEREYSEQEQQDSLEVLHWLANQPWSSGKVGMFGISWGGFNSIQLAMRRPPELKAILTVASSDDLFHDDIHYVDGMMHIDEFALSMDLENAVSPAPHFPIDEQTLQNRFDTPPWSIRYLKNQRDGKFWQHGSLKSNYSAIQIPVFMIGGLLDGYRDSIPRMLENMKVPMKAWMGPWSHFYPNLAVPGPAIEWRAEAVRWWDHWLKGVQNGIMQEPSISVYMRDWHPPDLNLETVPGHWRSEKTWPPAGQKSKTFFLAADHSLHSKVISSSHHDQLKYVPSVGVEAGFWWGDLTPDQRPLDAMSLVYETKPLKSETTILGIPQVSLFVSSDAPQANWFVRISDIAPDGTATLITGGGINGSQANSRTHPSFPASDEIYPLKLDLHFTTWVIPKGHRLRVGISNSLWPMIFPSPALMTTSLFFGGNTPSSISIPIVPESRLPSPTFIAPEPSAPLPGVRSQGSPWPGSRTVIHDPVKRRTSVSWNGFDQTEFPWGIVGNREELNYEIEDLHTDTSTVRGYSETTVLLKDRSLKWAVNLHFTGDQTYFYYRYGRQLFENGSLIRERMWNEKIPRDHQLQLN